jgi:hypothetical protein
MKESGNGRILILKQCVGMRLAGEPVTKTTTLLGVSKATVSKVMLAYTIHGKTTSAVPCFMFTFGEHSRKPMIRNAWFPQ